MERETFYVGMDLGSFKTSVMASNGRRETLHTIVGWPKDHVARAMLGCDVVFGEQVMQKRLALDVVRPFEKGALKYSEDGQSPVAPEEATRRQKAARLLVQHIVSQLRPGKDAVLYGVIGAPSRATLLNKQVILEAVQGVFDAAMVVAEPFAVAYGANRLSDCVVIDIGAGTTDICPIYGTYPKEEDQVTVPLGGDAIDDAFLKALHRVHPQAQLSINMAREIKEKFGAVNDAEEAAVVELPVGGRPTPLDIGQPLLEACRMIVKPLVEGLLAVVSRFDPEFQRSLLSNIVLAGGGSQLRGLDRVIEEAVRPFGGGKVIRANDSIYAGAAGALKLAMGMPAQHWQKLQATDHRPASGASDKLPAPTVSRRSGAALAATA
jgi:rod shape-determining protein MreB